MDCRPRARDEAASVVLCALALSGCSGVQSALDPQSDAAREIGALFWTMTAAGAVIFVAFMALALHAARTRAEPWTPERAHKLIVIGAVVAPTLLLAALLVHGLRMLPAQLAPAPPGSMRIRVTGLQYWWRVRYEPPDGAPFETANELRLPVNRPVQLVLDSPDVIHSFWVPSLTGKMDMIPGRTTRLVLHPTRTGTYRGACAEYCGTSHAWMAFTVVVQEDADFARWTARQREAAREPESAQATAGRAAFLESGCGACHGLRGTAARGVLGPDLTHVGGRLSVGAGRLPHGAQALADFITRTEQLKPGVHMPAFGMLPAPTIDALAAYLEGLE
ncbi:MAG: cytochrome c oxidase subunit II [Polyangiales bacterium]